MRATRLHYSLQLTDADVLGQKTTGVMLRMYIYSMGRFNAQTTPAAPTECFTAEQLTALEDMFEKCDK